MATRSNPLRRPVKAPPMNSDPRPAARKESLRVLLFATFWKPSLRASVDKSEIDAQRARLRTWLEALLAQEFLLPARPLPPRVTAEGLRNRVAQKYHVLLPAAGHA